MSTATTTMTDLDAVNIMLAITGESPINSLLTVGLGDVVVAKSTLDEVSREVQSRGWNFNVENEYPISPDTEGHINIPSNTVRVKPSLSNGIPSLIARGLQLYDRKNHTFVFSAANMNLPTSGVLKMDFVWLLEYSLLPQEARYYIAIRAARKFQRRVLGEEALERYTAEEELTALTGLQDADCEAEEYNLITGNTTSLSIISRY